QRAAAGDRGRLHDGTALGGAGDEACEGHRVAAHVQDAAAGRLEVEEPPAAAARVEGEGGVHMGDLTDRPVGHELQDPDGLGVETVHVRLEQDPVGAGGEV